MFVRVDLLAALQLPSWRRPAAGRDQRRQQLLQQQQTATGAGRTVQTAAPSPASTHSRVSVSRNGQHRTGKLLTQSREARQQATR